MHREPIYQFCKALCICACVKDVRMKEIKVNSKVMYVIQYQYNNLFIVKLTVKTEATVCKVKDVAVFALSEAYTTPYSDTTELISKSMSSLDLYRQITFAAKRVCMVV